MKVLLIDNYDSFTYNLFHYVSKLKCKVDVVRNDKITSNEIKKKNIKRLLYLQVLVIHHKLETVLKL